MTGTLHPPAPAPGHERERTHPPGEGWREDEVHQRPEPVQRHATEGELAEEVATYIRDWKVPGGFRGWMTSVDHKSVAKRYIVTALVWFTLAGALALLMRTQLARPENGFLDPDRYNQFFTTHGSAMMFLFAVPIMQAVGLYLVPLMVGTRNIALPRLNALGYWVYLIAGLLLWVGLFTNTGADTGWFSYVPLSGPQYAPGKRADVWSMTVSLTEVSALIAAVEIIVTVAKTRAPGMTLNRIPIFVWALVVTSFMVCFAMATVATGSMFLSLDRLVGTHFFNPAEGGDPILWQHLFWWFGHPEVYIIFIPALGMISSIISASCRRPVFGYPAVVLSMIGTGFMSFGLWVHHMFATPLPQLGMSFFTAASAFIAVFTGTQIFCWIATIWLGRPRFDTAFLFVLGFFVLFLIGGVTGVMIASVPFDLQAHDTYFIVAHFHYVLIGGAVAPLLGAFYFWFPKVTGRMLSERMGKWNFWLFFIGVNLTFFPMHFVGLWGMPRRVYTYQEASGWATLNLVETVGAYVIGLSVLLFVVNVARSLWRGARAGDDPWHAETLEWAAASPPAPWNFVHIPVVQGRSPLWEQGPDAPVVTGLRADRREVLLTSVLDAEPETTYDHPKETIAPFLAGLAIGAFFIVSIFTPWGAVIGGLMALPAFLLWGWPRGDAEEEEKAREAMRRAAA